MAKTKVDKERQIEAREHLTRRRCVRCSRLIRAGNLQVALVYAPTGKGRRWGRYREFTHRRCPAD